MTLAFLFLLLFAGVWVGFALIAAAVVGLWWLGRDPVAGIAHAFWSMGANWTTRRAVSPWRFDVAGARTSAGLVVVVALLSVTWLGAVAAASPLALSANRPLA
ncbi:hypothetical protein [Hydrogenophilus thermoluteolus]|uniref:hypothetical protein n=1 Tax=Hydrogenophilus thermoluteolus TaxID=297 RepID=UPI003F66D916